MLLISKEAAIRAACKAADEWHNRQDRSRNEYISEAIANVPSTLVVPLEPLCKLLSDIYGSPCQLGEIEPYAGCEPDDEGNCFGMRESNFACWKDFLLHNIGAYHD